MKKRSRGDVEMKRARAVLFAGDGYGAKEIAGMIGSTERSVQRYLRQSRPIDVTPLWSAFIPKTRASDVALCAPALASIMQRSGKIKFTQAEIAAVLRVRRMAPDLPSQYVWSFAMSLMRVAAGGRDAEVESLLVLLAFAPWRSAEARAAFLRWVIDYRPGWLLERATVGAGEIRPGPPVKIRGLKLDPGAMAPGVKTWAEVAPSGVGLRPVTRGQPIPADAVGLMAGVAIALEIGNG